MSVTPFVITTAGLAAATTAGTGGPKIDITQFKLGSAFNYTPNAGMTGLNGSTLYTGVIASATPINGDTMDIVLQIPAAAGPFDFGEIGIYMGSTMFAKCAYTSLQSKLSDAVNGVGSVYTIHALIKLADASALFNFTYNTITSIPVITGSAVTAPDNISSTCNAIIAMDRTPTAVSDPILLTRKNGTTWNVESANYIATFTPTAATTTTVTSLATFGVSGGVRGPASMTVPTYRYLMQRQDTGQIVPIVSVNAAGVATLDRAVSWTNTTSTFLIYDTQGKTISSVYLRGTAFCGTPIVDDDSEQIINSSWYMNQANFEVPLMDGVASVGTSLRWARGNHRHPTDSTRAPSQSPTFGGTALYDPGNVGTPYEIGFRGTPPVINPTYTIPLSYNGKSIFNVAVSNGGTGKIQISSVLTTPGFTCAIVNNCQNGTDAIDIDNGGQMTIRLAGTNQSSQTGKFKLGPRGMLSVLVVSSSECWISGVGIYQV